MSFLPEEWYVRESVRKELNAKILDIVSYALDTFGDQFLSNDDEVASDVLAMSTMEYVDMSQFTEDEAAYALEHIYYYCCIGFAHRHGLLKEDPNGHLVLPKSIKNL
jgi:hypothetical protein